MGTDELWSGSPRSAPTSLGSGSSAQRSSHLIGAGGSAKLAPLYDLMRGEVWPRITKWLPQATSGRTEAANIHALDRQALARNVGFSRARTLRCLAELCALVSSSGSEARERVAAMPTGAHPLMMSIVRAIQKRCERIRRRSPATASLAPRSIGPPKHC